MRLAMTPVIEREISFFFERHGESQRSTTGFMFERAANARLDSAGKPVSLYDANWAWRPNGEDQPIPINETREEAGYMPNLSRMALYGRASRRLRAVERHDRRLAQVLEAYYGDSGNRWREAAKDRFDDKGRAERRGFGPGAIASVYRLTEAGDRILFKARKARLEREPDAHVTADELLEAVLAAQAAQPNKRTEQELSLARVQAEQLLTAARSAYLTAISVDVRRAQQRRGEPRQRCRAWHSPLGPQEVA